MYYVPAWTHTHPHTHTSHSYLGNLGLFPSRMEYHADACEREGWLLTCGVGSLGWVLALEGRLFDQTLCVRNCIWFYSFPKSCPKRSPAPFHRGTPAISVCVSHPAGPTGRPVLGASRPLVTHGGGWCWRRFLSHSIIEDCCPLPHPHPLRGSWHQHWDAFASGSLCCLKWTLCLHL